MSIFWRYQLALLGGLLAMSAHMYLVFGRGGWLAPQRVGNAIAAGLLFGHVLALMVLIARDTPLHFYDRWPAWMRCLLSISGGIALGTMAWWLHITLILFNAHPDWRALLFGGAGLSLGFVLAAIIPLHHRHRLLRTALHMIITAIATYIPIYLTYQNFLATVNSQRPAQALLYFQVDNPAHVWLIGLPFALSIAVIGQASLLFELRPSQHVEP